MMMSRADIMNFDTRSTPFSIPSAHTMTPTATETSIHAIISDGFDTIAPNAAAVVSATAPLNMPDAILGMYESIQPQMVV